MRMLEYALRLLFPEDVCCFVCREPAIADENGLCQSCRAKIKLADDDREIDEMDGISGITAGLSYTDALHSPMHRLKYEGARHLARNFSSFIYIPPEWGISLILPVPLHVNRQKERGYNQSELIATHLGKRYNLPVSKDILKREQETQSQTHLNKQERVMNVLEAFTANAAIKGETPVIIDDVVTTGSTLSACARVLLNAGAKKVYAATACRAQLRGRH